MERRSGDEEQEEVERAYFTYSFLFSLSEFGVPEHTESPLSCAPLEEPRGRGRCCSPLARVCTRCLALRT